MVGEMARGGARGGEVGHEGEERLEDGGDQVCHLWLWFISIHMTALTQWTHRGELSPSPNCF